MKHPIYARWVTAGILLTMAVCLPCCKNPAQQKTGRPAWQCALLQVPDGYGYVVYCGPDTLIRQTCIPAIGGRRPFGTAQEALAVGQMVCGKLRAGESPSVSREEVEEVLAGLLPTCWKRARNRLEARP